MYTPISSADGRKCPSRPEISDAAGGTIANQAEIPCAMHDKRAMNIAIIKMIARLPYGSTVMFITI
jgi:hypothetical protein